MESRVVSLVADVVGLVLIVAGIGRLLGASAGMIAAGLAVMTVAALVDAGGRR